MATNVAAAAVTITREFDAPRELVWKAWTDPEHFARWWGPADYSAPSIHMDARPGGSYLWCMRNDEDGNTVWTTGTFREVHAPSKLVYVTSFADADGNVVPASHYGMDSVPMEMEVTVTLEDIGGRTRMTVQHIGLPGEYRDEASAGWTESFDKLAASLA